MTNQLALCRKRAGLTQKQLGAEIGVTYAAISNYETRKRQIEYETALKLGEILDCTVAEIYGQEELRPRSQESALERKYRLGDPFVGYILLMIYTGMMPAEVLACRKSMIDMDKNEIFGCGAKTKSRKNSAIVFPEFLRPVVESFEEWSESKNNFYDEYHECLKRAGVRKLPPYSCRHTYGTEAVKLGVHPAVVQKMLRHSTQRTQERYTHLSSEEAHEAANLFNRGTQVAHNEPGKP